MKEILVPTGKCPLDVIAEMGDTALNGLFVLDIDCVSQLVFNADKKDSLADGGCYLEWNESTDEKGKPIPSTKVYMTQGIYKTAIITQIEASVQPNSNTVYKHTDRFYGICSSHLTLFKRCCISLLHNKKAPVVFVTTNAFVYRYQR